MRLIIIPLAAMPFLPHVSIRPVPATPLAESVAVNDNMHFAGTMRDGVLTVHIEARAGEWHPDGDKDPGILVRAFAEAGRPATVPGPLIRVPAGTTIHAFVSNTLDSAIVVHGLAPRGKSLGTDTLSLRPGETRELRFLAGEPGTYYYWGSTSSSTVTARSPMDSQLSGAFIVDPEGPVDIARDRVLVLSLWGKVSPALARRRDVLRFTINGKAWPNTERLSYALGDSIRFRLVNVSAQPHPMHLHGFYFDVESRGDGSRDSVYHGTSRHLAVTERVAPGRTAMIAWRPERAGYWLFHCHDNAHVLRNAPLDGSPVPPEQSVHVHNHTTEMMGGLVMAILVREPVAMPATLANGTARRQLRLIARVDPHGGGTDDEPAYGYILDGRTPPNDAPLLPGPVILLKRGEPVSITVVNELAEATAVHWHGIELDSYYDGVADFSGQPGHIAPAIAPRDSFVAQFTPPRAGTFMYHPHADELRQQQAGLSGALLVLADPATYDPVHDLVFLVSVPRRNADANRVLLNGSLTPSPLELHVGEHYRFRLVDIHPFRPSMIARLLRDTVAVTWRGVAKDGMDLPSDQATLRPAVQQMGNGETYDFEVVPDAPGLLNFTVSAANGPLLVSMPVHVSQ